MVQKSSRLTTIADLSVTVAIVTLPYVIYLGLAALLVAIVTTAWTARSQLWQPRIVAVLGAIALGLVGHVGLAFYKAEAALQLANFLPFFLIFAVLIQRLNSVQKLYDLAWHMVLASVPINLIAIAEYILKIPRLKAEIDLSNVVLNWFYRHNYGHRANSVFGHPNTYVSYLILVLALGIGLLLAQAAVPTLGRSRPWLYGALGLMGVGIFCAGSRNGLFVAVAELLILTGLSWRQRLVRWIGLVGGSVLVSAALIGGVGGRQIDWDDLLVSLWADPRPSIWAIAVQLGSERPWWGWGLGNYKYLYPPRSLRPDYPFVSHAHNFWLQMYAETGVILTLALTLTIGYIAYRGVRAYQARQLSTVGQHMLLAYQLGMWSFMLFAMLDLPYYDARINALNWLMLAGVYGLAHGWEPEPLHRVAGLPDKRA